MPSEIINSVSDEQAKAIINDISCFPVGPTNPENRGRFFELLIGSLPGIFYLFDENLQLLQWNINAIKATGLKKEEMPGLNLIDFIHGDDRQLIIDVVKNAFRVGQAAGEARLLSIDGAQTSYLFQCVTANIDGKNYLLGTGLDTSKLKEAEAAVKESYALYNLFAKRMTEGVILLHQYRILFSNTAAMQIFGYEEEAEFLSIHLDKIIDKEFLVAYRDMFESLGAGVCEEKSLQGRGVTKGGREIWIKGKATSVRWQGKPSILLLVRDVTEAHIRELNIQEEANHLRKENVILRNSMSDRYRFGSIIGKSPEMQKVYNSILSAAASARANVIIYGESGTGKELVAKEIHDHSDRCKRKFVAVNCAAIPETLLESEFFGCKRGAFTGASSDRKGYLEQADGGTLFLDEIGELDINLQAKLLRAIDGGGFTPVGENVSRNSDFRIVAATNRDLVEFVKQGRMREDFYYRIHIIPITLPALRTRKEDIPLLIENYLRFYTDGIKTPSIPGATMDALVNYCWRGNVRELRNAVQRFLSEGNFDFIVRANETQTSAQSSLKLSISTDQSLGNQVQELEKKILEEVLARFKGNKSRAAAVLGITRKTLLRKMIALGLESV